MEKKTINTENFSYKFGKNEKPLIEQIKEGGYSCDEDKINELAKTWNMIIHLLNYKLITYTDRDKIMKKLYKSVKDSIWQPEQISE